MALPTAMEESFLLLSPGSRGTSWGRGAGDQLFNPALT